MDWNNKVGELSILRHEHRVALNMLLDNLTFMLVTFKTVYILYIRRSAYQQRSETVLNNRKKLKHVIFFYLFVIEAESLQSSLFGNTVSFMTIYSFTVIPVCETRG